MNTWIWTLNLLLVIAKAEAPSKYVPTYETTAAAITTAAEEAPLPLGEDAAHKTMTLLAAWTWAESRFNQRAIGDHGTSFCAMQVNNSNFKALGVANGEELLNDPLKCMRAGLRMLADSFRMCASRPMGERGAWYILGGKSCSPNINPEILKTVYAQSRSRFALGKKLYESNAPPTAEPLTLLQ